MSSVVLYNITMATSLSEVDCLMFNFFTKLSSLTDKVKVQQVESEEHFFTLVVCYSASVQIL